MTEPLTRTIHDNQDDLGPVVSRGRHRRAPSDDSWRYDRIGSARRGENPTLLARMRTGWAVIGDSQHLPGYCVLLYDGDDVEHLMDLPRSEQVAFLSDMALLGEAVFASCNGLDPAFRRINYEVLGNSMRQLHAHVHARYAWEPEQFRIGPVWRYPTEVRNAPENLLGDQHDGLQETIALALERVMADAYGTI